MTKVEDVPEYDELKIRCMIKDNFTLIIRVLLLMMKQTCNVALSKHKDRLELMHGRAELALLSCSTG